MRTSYCSLLLLLLSVWGSNAQVVINEIMFYPKAPQNEWVELYNPTSSAVILNGWTIKDAAHPAKALSGTVPQKGYLIVARHPDSLLKCYLKLEKDCVIQATLSLNHEETEGDSIILSKADGTVAEAMYYWKKEVKKGQSLERKYTDMPASDSANWQPSSAAERATPCGERATPCRPNSIASGTPAHTHSRNWRLRYDRNNGVINVSWKVSEHPLSITTFTLSGEQEATVTPGVGTGAALLAATSPGLRIVVATWSDGSQQSQIIPCY